MSLLVDYLWKELTPEERTNNLIPPVLSVLPGSLSTVVKPLSVPESSIIKNNEPTSRKKVFEDIKEEEEIFTSSVDEGRSQSVRKHSRKLISYRNQ